MKVKTLAAAVTIFTLAIGGVAFGAESPETVLSYDSALEMALKNNSTLKDFEETLEVMEDSKAQLLQTMGVNHPGVIYTSPFVTDDVTRSLIDGIASIDAVIMTAEDTRDLTKAGVEMAVKSSFINIINTKADLKVLKQTFDVAMEGYSNAQLMYRLGLISKMELDSAGSNKTSLEASLSQLELVLDTYYTNLNQLLGLSLDSRYELEYNLEYAPFKLNTTEAGFISAKISSDPYLKVQKAQAEAAGVSLNTYTVYSKDSYASKEAAYSQKTRAYADLVEDMKTGIHNGLNNINQLELSIKSLETELKVAQKTKEVAALNFELGNITSLENKQASLAYESKESELNKAIYNHDMAIYSVENPFLLIMK